MADKPLTQEEIDARLDAIGDKMAETLLKGLTPAEVQCNALSKFSPEEIASLKRDAQSRQSRRSRWWQFWK